MTLLNEICDSSRLVCVFFPNILLDRGNSCQFLAKSRMTLWRERARGREARVQSEESCSRGGRGAEAGRNTQLCFGEDEETQTGRDRARHSCVLVRMKKHKVKTTGYCCGKTEEEDRGALLRA